MPVPPRRWPCARRWAAPPLHAQQQGLCFDKLSMDGRGGEEVRRRGGEAVGGEEEVGSGKPTASLIPTPFALSLSKGGS